MGWSPNAVTVFGIKIPESDLVKNTIKAKRYKHEYEEDIKFCPKTGKELWYDEKRYYLPLEYEGESIMAGEPIMPEGLGFTYVTEKGEHQCFFGWTNSANQYESISEGEFNEEIIRGKVADYFNSHGFDSSSYEFKLYTILD